MATVIQSSPKRAERHTITLRPYGMSKKFEHFFDKGYTKTLQRDVKPQQRQVKCIETSSEVKIEQTTSRSRIELPRQRTLRRQPSTRPITEEQLINEVKGIYAGLVMIEKKCVEIAAQQSQSSRRLSDQQWKPLITLHHTHLQEHYDFFSATNHPSAQPGLEVLRAENRLLSQECTAHLCSNKAVYRFRLPQFQSVFEPQNNSYEYTVTRAKIASTFHADSDIYEGSSHLTAFDVSAWKAGAGRSKSWRGAKLVKANCSHITSHEMISRLENGHLQTMIVIPPYLLTRRESRAKTRLLNCSKRRYHRPGHNLGELSNDWVMNLPLFDEDVNNLHEPTIKTRSEMVNTLAQSPPRSLKQLLSLTTIHHPYENQLSYGCFRNILLPPHYILLHLDRLERHFKVFSATNLNNDRSSYDITCFDIFDISNQYSPKGLVNYRMTLVKKLQRSPTYQDTVVHGGNFWIVQHRQMPSSMPGDERRKPKRQLPNDFLKKGTKEFKEAFPRLPQQPRLSMDVEQRKSCTWSVSQSGRTKSDKKREAQRQRRIRKRAVQRAGQGLQVVVERVDE